MNQVIAFSFAFLEQYSIMSETYSVFQIIYFKFLPDVNGKGSMLIFRIVGMEYDLMLHWITMKCAVSRMQMPHVREYTSSLLKIISDEQIKHIIKQLNINMGYNLIFVLI